MIELNLIQILTLLSGIVCFLLSLYPFMKLFSYFTKTKIFDYLIFSVIFLLGGFTVLIISSLSIFESVWIYQISEFSIDFAFYLLLIHAVRINAPSLKNRVFLTIGTIWLLVLIYLTLTWDIIPNDHSYTYLLNLTPFDIDILYPVNYGAVINDTIILSVDFRFFANFFHFLSSLYVFLEYKALKLEIKYQNDKIRKGLFNYKLSLGIITFSRLFLFPLSEIEFVLVSFLFLIPGFYYMLKIMLYYPETMLVSQIQLTRVIKMYDSIPLLEDESSSKDHTLLELKEYMESIKNMKFELSKSQ